MTRADSSASADEADGDRPRTEERDEGVLVRRPNGPHCGVWVGHYANDPDSDVIEIQNVWGPKRRTQVTIPKEDVARVVEALEERV